MNLLFVYMTEFQFCFRLIYLVLNIIDFALNYLQKSFIELLFENNLALKRWFHLFYFLLTLLLNMTFIDFDILFNICFSISHSFLWQVNWVTIIVSQEIRSGPTWTTCQKFIWDGSAFYLFKLILSLLLHKLIHKVKLRHVINIWGAAALNNIAHF